MGSGFIFEDTVPSVGNCGVAHVEDEHLLRNLQALNVDDPVLDLGFAEVLNSKS